MVLKKSDAKKLENLLSVIERRVKLLCSISEVKHVLPVWFLHVQEQVEVIDVGHLESQFSNREFAVLVQSFEYGRVLPHFMLFLLEQQLNVVNF